MYYARDRPQTVVRGCIATSRCHRTRLPPDGWWPLAVEGGPGGGGGGGVIPI